MPASFACFDNSKLTSNVNPLYPLGSQGKEAALVCAEWGASVVLACRDPPAHEQHPEATIDEIVKRTGAKRENLEWWEVDYGSLESVAKFAKRYVDSGRTLDLLFNNAGLAVGE